MLAGAIPYGICVWLMFTNFSFSSVMMKNVYFIIISVLFWTFYTMYVIPFYALGAEVLVKLTLDPQELNLLNRPIHFARALENQAYFVSTNACGFNGGSHLYGGSMVISPEGHVLWEATQQETLATVTLDLDLVSRCRNYGTFFMDHYLQHVRKFDFPMPFAGRAGDAPVFASLQEPPCDFEEYDRQSAQAGAGTIGIRSPRPEPEWETYRARLKEFLETRSR